MHVSDRIFIRWNEVDDNLHACILHSQAEFCKLKSRDCEAKNSVREGTIPRVWDD